MSKRKHYSQQIDSNASISSQTQCQQVIPKEEYAVQPQEEAVRPQLIAVTISNVKKEYINEDNPLPQINLNSQESETQKQSTGQANTEIKVKVQEGLTTNQLENKIKREEEAQKPTTVTVIQPKVKVEQSSQDQIRRIFFSPQTKFYLFADQVVDINYIRNIAQNTHEEYLKEEQKICIFKNLKHIFNITHRMDNKCIEVKSEVTQQYLEDVNPIINMMLSLGDQMLFSLAQNIAFFWNSLSLYRNQIRIQAENPLFQLHKKSRNEMSDLLFEQTVAQLETNKMVYYCYYKVNYEKQQFDSVCVGYSPALFELLGGNSYAFIDHISQKGFVDPLNMQYRLTKSFSNADGFLQKEASSPKEKLNELPESITQLLTLDQFQFPVIQKIIRFNLDKVYDESNGLHFNTYNILALYEYTLLDSNIPEQLELARTNTKYQSISNSQYNEVDSQFSKQNEFIEKYYRNDLSDLLNKGNKWFKRCGFVDIPHKKRKQNQRQFEEEHF